jgi:hypothetical protein
MRKFWFVFALAIGVIGTLSGISQQSLSAGKSENPANAQQPAATTASEPSECENCGDKNNFVNLQSSYWSCPIFPIYLDFFGTLYYCDRYYTPDCSDFPQADFVFGDYSWPYGGCGAGYCFAGGLGFLRENQESVYPGLPNYVAEDYLHTWTNENTTMAGQKFGDSCIPGGPARRSCQVVKDYDGHFLKATFQDAEVYAKILQFRISRKMATGKLVVTDIAKDPAAEVFYIAFQTAKSYGKPVDALDIAERGQHAFHCVADVGAGEKHRVLVLLKKSADAK